MDCYRTLLLRRPPPAPADDRLASWTLRVSVWKGAKLVVNDAHALWRPRGPNPCAESPRERLDTLMVELGPPGLGTTYDLMVAAPNDDPAAFGGKAWRPVYPNDPIETIRLFPEHGGSYYDALLGPWDDVSIEHREADEWWIHPYSDYAVLDQALELGALNRR